MTEDQKKRVADDELEFDQHGRATYEGSPYTGVAWESPSADMYMSEVEYIDGLCHGLAMDWYSEGHVALRQQYQYGAKQGEEAQWFTDGTRRLEAAWENGVRIRLRRWGGNGTTIVEEWELPSDDVRRKLARDLQAAVQVIGSKVNRLDEG